MSKIKKAQKPFTFFSTSLLVEITGKKAHHLKEFIEVLKTIDESSIFYHVHHSFREYNFAPGKYSNDFARWVADVLEENSLAEKLAAINIADFTCLAGLRDRLVEIITNHLNASVEIRKASPGSEFYFLRAVAIINPSSYQAWTLGQFTECLQKVGMRSLYHHFFDARLRLGHKTNDFSNWIDTALGRKELAQKIEQLDPYFMTMDQLKGKIIELCLAEEEKEYHLLDLTRFVAKKIINKVIRKQS